MTPPCTQGPSLPPLHCLWVRSIPSLSLAGRDTEGRRSGQHAAEQEETQLWHSHPLAFGQVSHFDGAHLVSHGQDTASRTG